jgi:glycosyltransferase involved in cell wall biosynthesis
MAFEYVCRNFLGNEKSENYSEIVQELISSYSVAGCNLSLKLHFLHSYLDLFLENIGTISVERDESFPQDIFQTEKRYSGKWSRNMSAEYCWSLIRETSIDKNKR